MSVWNFDAEKLPVIDVASTDSVRQPWSETRAGHGGASLATFAWAALILFEVLALTWFFDFQNVYDSLADSPILQVAIGRSGQIPRLVIGFLVVAGLHGGRTWMDELSRVLLNFQSFRSNSGRLLVHLVIFLAFVGCTYLLTRIDPASASAPPSIGFVITWFILAGSTGLSWLAIGLPMDQWTGVVSRRWPSALFATGGTIVAWLASVATASLWEPMVGGTFALVRLMTLTWAGNEFVMDPARSRIGTEQFAVLIAPACSGYEGVGLVSVVILAYLWIFRAELRFPRALVLLPIACVLSWFANALRIALLLAVGRFISPEIAAGGFHSQAGWIAFNAITLGLISLSRRGNWFLHQSPDASSLESGETINPTATYLAPFVTVIAATLLTAAMSVGFDRLYAIRIVAGSLTLWWYWSQLRSLDWSFSWGAVAAGVLVLVIWIGLEPAESAGAGVALSRRVAALPTGERLLWLFFRVAGSTLLIPIVEELAFRGFLTRRFISADFEQVEARQLGLVPILISSILFGLLHQRLLAGFLAGLIYGLTYRRRGSIGDASLAHAVTNGLISALVLLNDQWELWG